MELGQPVVADLSCQEVLRDDSHRLAIGLQHRVREHAHQTDIAATINQPYLPAHELCTQFLGGGSVLGAIARTGAAENADSSHAAILSVASTTEALDDGQESGHVVAG